MMSRFTHISLAVLVTSILAGCAATHTPHKKHYSSYTPQFKTVDVDKRDTYEQARALDLKNLPDVAGVSAKLTGKRVVFVGETHDRLDHHLNQLDIIKKLYATNPNIAIGMEYFEQPYQQALDDYVAGKIDEKDFVRKSGYMLSWGSVDYRLVRPIFQFAREKGIPLLALNMDGDLHSKAAREGVDKLTPEEKARLPAETDRSDTGYIERLKKYFVNHPVKDKEEQDKRIARYVDGQLLWDEYMAERAAQFLKDNPQRNLVVLAGSGHIAYGSGIPNRVNRRIPVEQAIVLNGTDLGSDERIADYIFFNRDIALPPHGLMGVVLEKSVVKEFAATSAGRKAGMELGDEIVAIGDKKVDDLVDIKFVLFEKKPGDTVAVTVKRKSDKTSVEKQLQVTLQ